jgi:hypothetical protein
MLVSDTTPDRERTVANIIAALWEFLGGLETEQLI